MCLLFLPSFSNTLPEALAVHSAETNQVRGTGRRGGHDPPINHLFHNRDVLGPGAGRGAAGKKTDVDKMVSFDQLKTTHLQDVTLTGVLHRQTA